MNKFNDQFRIGAVYKTTSGDYVIYSINEEGYAFYSDKTIEKRMHYFVALETRDKKFVRCSESDGQAFGHVMLLKVLANNEIMHVRYLEDKYNCKEITY